MPGPMEGVKVVALCDLVPENLDKAQAILQESGLPEADTYSGPEDWKKTWRWWRLGAGSRPVGGRLQVD